MTKCAKNISNRKYTKLLKYGSAFWWESYRTDAPVRIYLQASFPYKRPLSDEQLLQGIIDERFFGYVQCDTEVPGHLRDYFSNFPPILKITVVKRNDIEI